jgi:hypothetical protein
VRNIKKRQRGEFARGPSLSTFGSCPEGAEDISLALRPGERHCRQHQALKIRNNRVTTGTSRSVLKGRSDERFAGDRPVLFRPFRAENWVVDVFPKATPWADMFGPFGAEDKQRNIKTGASG